MKYEIAKKHLTETVAHIFHDTVMCELSDRALTDWLEAEKAVDGDQGFQEIIHMAVGDWAIGRPGRALPDTATFEDFAREFGNEIWMHISRNRCRANLPRPPYGSIIFQ